MGFNFRAAGSKAAKRTRQGSGTTAHQEAAEYRERARQEEERRKLATDASIFSCICFSTKAKLDSAVSSLGIELECGKYTYEDVIRPALVSKGFSDSMKSASNRPVYSEETFPNPLDGIERTGDTELDIAQQFLALYDAFLGRKDKGSYKSAIDSPYWLCVIFRSCEDRNRFLDDFGFSRFGIAYVDGDKALRSIV